MHNSVYHRNPSHNNKDVSSFPSTRPSSFSKFSLQINSSLTSNGCANIGTSPKSNTHSKCAFNGNNLLTSNLQGSLNGDIKTTSRSHIPESQCAKEDLSVKYQSSGPIYMFQANKELSSIEKINDNTAQRLIAVGKNHLGIYKFQSDNGITLLHDFIQRSPIQSTKPLSNFRRSTKKLSTISDVKSGFHHHKNYVAVCGTSTSISIYDINRESSIDNPLVTVLSEHTRSINSVDFNMGQTNLLISGGQDGCIKIWDIRSNQGKLSRSDISINTGSDSIRDIKWMPSYDFVNNDNSNFSISNRSFKFASIYDSGLLLKFDLRQPNQVEKKINAHSGPGLCMNWHPHLDYIISGGRDGKCCLWYIGDRPGSHTNLTTTMNLVPNYSIHTAPTSVIFPEVIINTSYALTKLKFCPSYVKNVFNSLVSTSVMGEDSNVSVYSLSRRHIPRNILTTPFSSLGFVWWNEDLIFNIDKQNIITGWNINQEPTLLENLRKDVVCWRDMDGNGLIFMSQDRGKYISEEIVLTPGSNGLKHSQHKLSAATMNNLFSGNSRNGSLIPPAISHNHHLNSFVNEKERSIPSKGSTSLSGKFTGNLPMNYIGGAFAQNHNSSVISTSNSGTAGVFDNNDFLSPIIMSLDLPQLTNNMRTVRIPNIRKKKTKIDIDILKESPVEAFKFLSRELKFSMQENHCTKVSDVEDGSQSVDESNLKTYLIKKLGIDENKTWINLVKSTNSYEALSSISKSRDSNSLITSSDNILDNDINHESITKMKSDTDANQANLIKIQESIDQLIELASICDHNAETYAYIDNIANFKLWIMIRDVLLWDLGRIYDQNMNEFYNEQKMVTNIPDRNSSFGSLSNSNIANSNDSNYSFDTDNNKLLVTNQNGLLRNFSFPSANPEIDHQVSNLQIQLQSNDVSLPLEKHKLTSQQHFYDESPRSSFQTASQNDLDGLGKLTLKSTDSEHTIDKGETDKLETNNFMNMDNNDQPLISSIPIQPKRNPRPSFIDAFIPNLRSPGIGHFDLDNEILSKQKLSPSFGASSINSINSKKSFIPSFNSSIVNMNLLKSKIHFINPGNKMKSGSQKLSDMESMMGSDLLTISEVSSKAHNSPMKNILSEKQLGKKITPPWNASKLIKEIYEQSVEIGNILLTVNILLLFQEKYHITSTAIAKDTIIQFISILHRYELFEISADILKYCPWNEFMDVNTCQSTVTLFCDKCGKLIVNEHSKEKLTLEYQSGNKRALDRFGYWYCDACHKRNTLCAFCEKPIKKLSVGLLSCGHEGHYQCFKEWFLYADMNGCPAGCPIPLF